MRLQLQGLLRSVGLAIRDSVFMQSAQEEHSVFSILHEIFSRKMFTDRDIF